MTAATRLFAAIRSLSDRTGFRAVRPQGLDIAAARVVDLTHTIDANMVFWPTDQDAFELIEVHKGPTEGGFFYAANRFCSHEHVGTHVDAPFHFAEQGETVGDIAVTRFVGPAVVIDICAQAVADRDYTLRPDDVIRWEGEHGEIAAGAVVILRTGWSSRWPDTLAYLGDDTPGDASNLHFPSFGPDAARMLVERGVTMIGVDTASVDNGPSQDFQVHRIIAAANVIGLENLTNLEQLPAKGAWVLALPMKLANGSGAPARVIALVP